MIDVNTLLRDESTQSEEAIATDASSIYINGTESFVENYTSPATGDIEDVASPRQDSTPMAALAAKQARADLFIRTSDNRNFRVYLATSTSISPVFINKFCRFLDNRKEGETVELILGVKTDDNECHMLGGIVSALCNCKAKTIGVAAGYCSAAETMMWVFCQEQRICRYGAVSFCTSEIIKECPPYKAYFEAFLNRARDLDIITASDAENILETNQEYFLMYQDFVNGKVKKEE